MTIKSKYAIRLIGILFGIISLYWLFKIGYHVIFYKSTGGLDNNTFGYPKDYWEVLTPFVFWLIIFIGGLGIVKTNKTGLIIGLIATMLSGILSLICSIFISIHKSGTLTNIIVNGEARNMTFSEKWNLIYSEPLQYIFISLFLISVTILIIRKLKQINKNQPPTRRYSA
jgi:hypothetical protein